MPATSIQELSKLIFDEQDVLTRDEDLRVRLTNIDKAIALRSSKENKTSVILKTKSGLIKMDTGILSHDSNSVYTDGGYKIPLQCIYSVDFY